jgi:hypothetical protein
LCSIALSGFCVLKEAPLSNQKHHRGFIGRFSPWPDMAGLVLPAAQSAVMRYTAEKEED